MKTFAVIAACASAWILAGCGETSSLADCAARESVFEGEVSDLSEADYACRTRIADLDARAGLPGDAALVRALRWNGQGAPGEALLEAARRVDREALAAALHVEYMDSAASPIFYDPYECAMAIGPWEDLLEQARAGPVSINCDVLREAAPAPYDVTALARLLPWDGRCPAYREVMLMEADIRPVRYAARTGSVAAVDCMIAFAAERAERVDLGEAYYWTLARAWLTGEPRPSPPPGLDPVWAESARQAARRDFGEGDEG